MNLTKDDLLKPLKDFPKCQWMEYSNAHDFYQIKIENTNLGYSVMVSLNHVADYTLRGIFFKGTDSLGTPMLHSAKAPKNMDIRAFFFDLCG